MTIIDRANKHSGLIGVIVVILTIIIGWITTFSKIPAYCSKVDALEVKTNEMRLGLTEFMATTITELKNINLTLEKMDRRMEKRLMGDK